MQPIELSICVGSSCHLKGSKAVIDAFRDEIAKRGLEEAIVLKAAFCLGHCTHEGVCVKVGDVPFAGLTPEKVADFLDGEVLPRLP